MFNNLSSSDHGLYHIEHKVSVDKTSTNIIKLVIGDPPKTVDGKLMIMADSSNDTVVRLMCGAFTSLGYPPVSTIWKDPMSQLLASTGFTGQYFTLDLPAKGTKSGRYCCHLDCRIPNNCCLDDQSPLRQCATIDVHTGKNDVVATEESVSLRNVINVAQETDRTPRHMSSQKTLAAITITIPEEEDTVPQIDKVINNLLSINEGMEDFRSRMQDDMASINDSIKSNQREFEKHQTSMEALKEVINNQQGNAETWMSQTSDGLIQMKNIVSTIGQRLASLEKKLENQIPEISLDNCLQTDKSNSTDQLVRAAFCKEKGYTPIGGLCLKFHENRLNYTSAQSVCEAEEGHLVHLTYCKQDFQLLLALVGLHGKQLTSDWQSGVWIGLRDMSMEGNFTWTDGTALRTKPSLWLRGQPDNTNNKEHCVEAMYVQSPSFNDYHCGESLQFVCQIDL